MERSQEELQVLGFFGILKESFKLIFKWKKIFTQITLSLIIPLCIIFLVHIQISNTFFYRIRLDKDDDQLTSPTLHRYRQIDSSEWAAFWLFEAIYLTFILILSLLSTSAVAYTIACIYSAKEITLKKVMNAIPKVWKRLIVTILLSFVIVFVYNVIVIALIYFVVRLGIAGLVAFIVILILYLIGFVYIGIVWHLASVVSVLEDLRGLKALAKSKNLIKGKMGVTVVIFVLLSTYLVAIEFTFEIIVMYREGLVIRIVVGIICMVLLFKLVLCGLVIQSVIYFVCKSYHHESIDRAALLDHLEVIHLGKYVPPAKSMDIQLQ
ncbi:hypothetical protein ACFE04_014345 [Oxalis oulophora]